jgi:hypothetical protein
MVIDLILVGLVGLYTGVAFAGRLIAKASDRRVAAMAADVTPKEALPQGPFRSPGTPGVEESRQGRGLHRPNRPSHDDNLMIGRTLYK